jgi:hypothetical protein
MGRVLDDRDAARVAQAMIASMSEVWPRMWLMMTAEMSSSSLAAKSSMSMR